MSRVHLSFYKSRSICIDYFRSRDSLGTQIDCKTFVADRFMACFEWLFDYHVLQEQIKSFIWTSLEK